VLRNVGSGTVVLITNPVISHERREDQEVSSQFSNGRRTLFFWIFRRNCHCLDANFVNPYLHAQNIENMWMRVKLKQRRQFGTSRALFQTYLSEFRWRNIHRWPEWWQVQCTYALHRWPKRCIAWDNYIIFCPTDCVTILFHVFCQYIIFKNLRRYTIVGQRYPIYAANFYRLINFVQCSSLWNITELISQKFCINNYTITNWRVSLSKIYHEWPNNAVTHECAQVSYNIIWSWVTYFW